MTLATGSRLGPYEVLSPLGAGGMGEVYRARDTRLGRFVAIKVLPEELSADQERLSRFEREARSASALNHPNIVTIYEVGQSGSRSYIAMELVEGETLREMLASGPFPAQKLVSIGAQAAEGLAKAHTSGIVHRDLKPENVMVTRDGLVKILDFGLAKLTETYGRPGEQSLAPTMSGQSQPGVVLGTVGYMSPEQASGRPLDFRSDQFSLGAILYEMATGKRAFQRATAVETLSAIIREEPEPVALVNPETPEPLRWIVKRCLSKDPEGRYASTRDLAHDLKALPEHTSGGAAVAPGGVVPRRSSTIWWGAAVLGVVALASFILLRRTSRSTIDSLAVLPFVNSSPDPSAEYLSDGITDSLINNLSQLPKLQVMAHSTVFSFKGRATDPRQIGRELHVGAVLTGRMVQRGDTLVIAAELVDVSNGAQLWGEQYNRKLSEILAVQDEIVSEIADRLKVKLTGEDKKRLTRRYTDNTEAYQAYLKGRYYAGKYTVEGWKKAFEYFHQAIEIDPTYALAYAGLTVACWNVSSVQRAPREVMPEAEEAARKAVEIDDKLAEAHASLALVKMAYDWDRPTAEKEYRRAIALNPGYSSVHQWYGWHLALLGRLDEAIDEMKRAQRLDPLSGEISAYVGLALYWARRNGEAIEQFRKSLELDPDSWLSHSLLGWAYLQNGQTPEAFAEIQRSRQLDDNPWTLAQLGQAYAVSGKRAESERVLQELSGRAKRGYVSKYQVAKIYAALGEKEKAFEWMEKAFEDRDEAETWLKVDPMMDGLRSDPRYADLLRRLGLPA